MQLTVAESIAICGLCATVLTLVWKLSTPHLSLTQCNERHAAMNGNLTEIKDDVRTIKKDLKDLTYKVMEVIER